MNMLARWFFKDKNGRIVIAQWPNLPLVVFFVLKITSYAVSDDSLKDLLQTFASAALVYWALLEVFKGTNEYRRMIGSAVLLAIVFSLR